MVFSKLYPKEAILKGTSFFRPAQNMGTWAVIGAAGAVAVAGVAILCNLPTNPFVKAPKKATLEYLANTNLQTIGGEKREFKASELWNKDGAVVMAVRRPG